jgi:hypothetical protein
MVRPRKQIATDPIEIRNELISEFNAPGKEIKIPPVKNIYTYHPDCPYADKNTGMVLESHYVYWRFYPKDIIKSNETIGHRNNDRTDNHVENLYKKEKKKKPVAPVPGYMPKMSESPDRDNKDKTFRIHL